MPKVLYKSKRGAPEADWSDRDHIASNPRTSKAVTMKATSVDQFVARAHLKSGHCNTAATRDGRRRDLALKKICHKASKDKALQLPPGDASGTLTIPVSCPRSPGVTPDQISLWDCPLAIPAASLWGSSLALVETSTTATPAAADLAPIIDQGVSLPDNFQDMIVRSIQQILLASLYQTSRDSSALSVASGSHLDPCPEDFISGPWLSSSLT